MANRAVKRLSVLTLNPASASTMCSISDEPWGSVGQQEVRCWTLSNGNGYQAKVSNYGGILTSFLVPDGSSGVKDVVLGFDTLEGYLSDNCYFGATVGRYANRIAQGAFSLDGKHYQLAVNNGPNHLHGGPGGFNTKVFSVREAVASQEQASITLRYVSPHGEEQYPGEVTVDATYVLNNSNQLVMRWKATTDQPTVINLCNHSYWNLGGHSSGSVLDHSIRINADRFTARDDNGIPTGALSSVEGHPAMDFRSQRPIGQFITGAFKTDPTTNGGYDHNYVVNDTQNVGEGKEGKEGLRLVARVSEPISGRVMSVESSQPGVQFYTANYVDQVNGKNSAVYEKYGGFCLETQNFPDAINHTHFPSPVLRPGHPYHHTTIHTFA